MRVSVLGLGYVGCVSAACLAELGHTVVGLDIDRRKVESITSGRCPIVEPGLAELVARGRQRFEIFCSPCHGRTGEGQGMVVGRGFKQPESLHAERLVQTQDGYFYDVISNGFGQMSSYASQVKQEDRWAIVAYIRALQLSRRVPVDLLTAEERQRLASGTPAAPVAEAEEAH